MKLQIIIPIYRPDDKFLRLLSMIKQQSIWDIPVLLIDSGKGIPYADVINDMNVEVRTIDSRGFNHGGTRQWGIDQCPEADIYVFLTQDAIPADAYAIENLVAAFDDEQVGCAYGRQLPHEGAGVFGRIARAFNYPPESHIYGLEDRKQHGIKTAFISNSFAAYRKEAMHSVGGFPKDTILSEDMYVAAKMLLAGWRVAYVADAMVYHSHDYTMLQEFRRYFDIGVFHAREAWIQRDFGKAEGEGKRFVMTEFRSVMHHHPMSLWEIPLRDGLKYLGYCMGKREAQIPNTWKKKCSMFPQYWE